MTTPDIPDDVLAAIPISESRELRVRAMLPWDTRRVALVVILGGDVERTVGRITAEQARAIIAGLRAAITQLEPPRAALDENDDTNPSPEGTP